MPRIIALSLLALAACSDRSFNGAAAVVSLSVRQQVELCEDFLDDICSGELASFCDDPCINTGCYDASDTGAIDAECIGVAVQMVDDCAVTGSPSVCMAGGGCMIDALEAICP